MDALSTVPVPVNEPNLHYAPGSAERAELEQRLAELPADREVVAYCRGPFCAYAHDAVRRLHAAGRLARRLQDGWPEWHLAQRTPKTTHKRKRAA